MQTTFRAPFASRTPVAGRRSARCQATKPEMATLARRELLASGAAFAASLIAVASAQAAGESSATRAITAVTRPQQLAKKEENRKELKEQLQRVREGKEEPKF
eukprot:jgi/Chrzof1/7807/Cz02g37090.t1